MIYDDLRPRATRGRAGRIRGSRHGSTRRSATRRPSSTWSRGRLLRAGRQGGDRGRAVRRDDRPAPGRRRARGAGERRSAALRRRRLRRRDGGAHRPPLARPRGRPGGDAPGRPPARSSSSPSTPSRCATSGWSATTSRRSPGCTRDRVSSLALAAEAARGERRPIPIPRDCSDLFFAALWARPGAGPRPRRRAADVGLAEPLRGRPARRAASGSPPTSPPAPGRSATATCASRRSSTSAYD